MNANHQKIQVIVDLLQVLGTPYVLSVGHSDGKTVTVNYDDRGDITTHMLAIMARAIIHGDGLDEEVAGVIPELVERINGNLLKEATHKLQPNEVN